MPDAEFPPAQKDKVVAKDEIVKLAEGPHSEVTRAFLVVARDPRVYRELRKLVPGLPNLLDDFFNGRAVVAAFLESGTLEATVSTLSARRTDRYA